jgi:WD40 repeat protein
MMYPDFLKHFRGAVLSLLIAVAIPGLSQTKPTFIWTTEWSNDGKYVALGGDDSTIWVYTAENYSLYRSFKLNDNVRCISWHPKEPLLAIATSNGVSMLSLQNRQVTAWPGLVGGRALAWNPTGELLALADGNGVLQIVNRNGRVLRSIKKYNNNCYFSVDWHPTKPVIVTGGDEILVFDTTGKQLAFIKHRNVPTGVLAVKWHPSGEFFASGDYGHEKEGIPNLLQFWKADGTLIKEIRGVSKSEFRNIRWNHTGTLLATASDVLRTWDKDGRLVSTGPRQGDNLWGVAWSRDDSRIITGTFGTGSVKLWSSKASLIRDIN